MKLKTIVRAVIQNEKKQVLCCLRSHEMGYGGEWEFVGGKIDTTDNNATEALFREMDEELTWLGDDEMLFESEPLLVESHTRGDDVITMIFFMCYLPEHAVAKREHAAVVWVDREYLDSMKWSFGHETIVHDLIQMGKEDK